MIEILQLLFLQIEFTGIIVVIKYLSERPRLTLLEALRESLEKNFGIIVIIYLFLTYLTVFF